ncbi:VOC family protein [Nocardia sp. NBC_00511]|uniref:VOC family protein n=1 Tax=Nocardia sp. NBC_00511 TaxID=2903591 RepID=UPI0030E0BD0A
METKFLFSGVPVTDFAPAMDWYTRLFGREPDVLVTPGIESMWQLTETALIYIVVDPPRAGYALVNIAVPNLDAAVAQIISRGLAPGPFIHVGPDGAAGRKAPFTDPDGNSLFVIQIN